MKFPFTVGEGTWAAIMHLGPYFYSSFVIFVYLKRIIHIQAFFTALAFISTWIIFIKELSHSEATKYDA